MDTTGLVDDRFGRWPGSPWYEVTYARPTLGGLAAVEARSLAVRAFTHRPFEANHQPCGSCPPPNYGGVNLGLTNVCQAGHHDLCAGQVVVTAPGAPWSCGCLCHHARDRERGASTDVS